jgi:hypothetical protein
MEISGISGGFSANSLIAGYRRKSNFSPSAVLPPEEDDVAGLDPSDLGIPDLGSEKKQPAPGPTLRELIPPQSGERPFGLFRNERPDGGRFGQGAQGDLANLRPPARPTADPLFPGDDEPTSTTNSSRSEGSDSIGSSSQGDSTKATIQGIIENGVESEEATEGTGISEAEQEKKEGAQKTPKEQKPEEQVNNEQDLNEDEKKKVQELRTRDAEVVAHENAHKAAAGGLAGAIHFDTSKGPDGKSYRTGGHVNINTSKGKTPEETIQRAQTMRSAALAPASPSGADRSVANKASKMMTDARQEMAEERIEETQEAAEKLKENNEKTQSGVDETAGEEQENESSIKTTKVSVKVVSEEEENENDNSLAGNIGSSNPKTASADGIPSATNEDHEDPKIQPASLTGIPGTEETEDSETDLISNLGQAINNSQGQAKDVKKATPTPKNQLGNIKVPQFEVSKALSGYASAMMASSQMPNPGSYLRVRA